MLMLWRCAGILSVGLALVGTVLPVMPTVPFLIVAAYAFDRSSPRFHARLMAHPVFGPQIGNWRRHGAIATNVKILATGSMAAGLVVTFFILPWPLWLVQLTVISAVALFVVSRPAPPPA
ncbi:YbaN family protein [Paracoccus luteus]|uniref:YbaN family protein n=1 Tax=Paracoccus luteus TaxID=2508543 RepID=UPI00106FEAB7|nr:YbaN family protein [Paracoccus luteus]